MVQHCRRVGAQAGMHGRYLNDGATWRHQPVKAFRLAQLANGAIIAGANPRNKRQVGLNVGYIAVGRQRFQSGRI